MKNLLFSIILIFIIFISAKCSCYKYSNGLDLTRSGVENYSIPKEGFVPDSITAVKIAEAVWLPIYGKSIYANRPYNIELLNDSIWRISGTFNIIDTINSGQIIFNFGGVPIIEIRKVDGKIIYVEHSE